MKIVKVSKYQNVLNEDFSTVFGLSCDSQTYAGFSYELKPLVFSGEQKGNGPEEEYTLFNFYNGDYVEGECVYDGKVHRGVITYIHWETKRPYPKYVYITDFKTQQRLPLKPETVEASEEEQCSQGYFPFFGKNQKQVVYNYGTGTPYF